MCGTVPNYVASHFIWATDWDGCFTPAQKGLWQNFKKMCSVGKLRKARVLQGSLWRLLAIGMWCHVVWLTGSNIYEEHAVSGTSGTLAHTGQTVRQQLLYNSLINGRKIHFLAQYLQHLYLQPNTSMQTKTTNEIQQIHGHNMNVGDAVRWCSHSQQRVLCGNSLQSCCITVYCTVTANKSHDVLVLVGVLPSNTTNFH
jgi:hypothetical protein